MMMSCNGRMKSSAMLGVAAAMTAGAAVWMVVSEPMSTRRRAKRLKRSAERALSYAETLMDELGGMMR